MIMPFSLCNAPATFEQILKKYLCLVYLNYVIVFGTSFEKMLLNCKKIFHHLREINLKNNQKVCLGEKASSSLNKLNQALTFSPVLTFSKIEENLFLILMHQIKELEQSQKQNGMQKVIPYFSQVLNKAERNYCITRRKLLAIVQSIKSFHHYLY